LSAPSASEVTTLRRYTNLFIIIIIIIIIIVRSLPSTVRLSVSFIWLPTITNDLYEHAGVGVAAVHDNRDRITTLLVGPV